MLKEEIFGRKKKIMSVKRDSWNTAFFLSFYPSIYLSIERERERERRFSVYTQYYSQSELNARNKCNFSLSLSPYLCLPASLSLLWRRRLNIFTWSNVLNFLVAYYRVTCMYVRKYIDVYDDSLVGFYAISTFVGYLSQILFIHILNIWFVIEYFVDNILKQARAHLLAHNEMTWLRFMAYQPL